MTERPTDRHTTLLRGPPHVSTI